MTTPKAIGVREALDLMKDIDIASVSGTGCVLARQERLGPGGTWRVARVAWVAANRTTLPAKAKVRSTCGNRHCVAPEHLTSAGGAAVAAMRAVGIEPSTPFPGVNDPWPSVCMKCGNAVNPRYGNVQRGYGGCKYCGHQAVDDAVATGIMMSVGFMPIAPFPGTDPWLCACTKCGMQSTPTLANARRGGSCRHCATRGFRPSLPGWVYLIERNGEQKVGITNYPDDRWSRHRSRGWTHQVDTWGPMPGVEAERLERIVKDSIRRFALPGSTEEWSTAHLRVDSIAELIQWAQGGNRG